MCPSTYPAFVPKKFKQIVKQILGKFFKLKKEKRVNSYAIVCVDWRTGYDPHQETKNQTNFKSVLVLLRIKHVLNSCLCPPLVLLCRLPLLLRILQLPRLLLFHHFLLHLLLPRLQSITQHDLLLSPLLMCFFFLYGFYKAVYKSV